MAQQNNCDNPQCCRIYLDNQHIKQRIDQEEILGSKGQFCGAFYHVPKWDYYDEKRTREYFCLDDNKCIIADRAKKSKSNGYVQPIDAVVAVVKFENSTEVPYEARYTNCAQKQKHAEDFFKQDLETGALRRIVRRTQDGTITMYLTLQPCNKSTTLNPEGTGGTQAVQSCCKTLIQIFENILQDNDKEIGLCVKVTHTNHLGPGREKDEMHARLRQNAEEGIRDLKKSGVSVERMTDVDWEYLFGLTSANVPLDNNDSRNDLDHTVEMILKQVN